MKQKKCMPLVWGMVGLVLSVGVSLRAEAQARFAIGEVVQIAASDRWNFEQLFPLDDQHLLVDAWEEGRITLMIRDIDAPVDADGLVISDPFADPVFADITTATPDGALALYTQCMPPFDPRFLGDHCDIALLPVDGSGVGAHAVFLHDPDASFTSPSMAYDEAIGADRLFYVRIRDGRRNVCSRVLPLDASSLDAEEERCVTDVMTDEIINARIEARSMDRLLLKTLGSEGRAAIVTLAGVRDILAETTARVTRLFPGEDPRVIHIDRYASFGSQPQFSPRGDQVFYAQEEVFGRLRIVVSPVDASSEPMLLEGTPQGSENWLTPLGDGRLVFGRDADGNGLKEIYVAAAFGKTDVDGSSNRARACDLTASCIEIDAPAAWQVAELGIGVPAMGDEETVLESGARLITRRDVVVQDENGDPQEAEVTVTVTYEDAELGESGEDDLELYQWVDEEWQPIEEESSVDADTNTVATTTTSRAIAYAVVDTANVQELELINEEEPSGAGDDDGDDSGDSTEVVDSGTEGTVDTAGAGGVDSGADSGAGTSAVAALTPFMTGGCSLVSH